MNLLVAGGYDTQNLGDYASLKGLMKVLTGAGIQPDVTVLSRHPEDGFAEQLGVKVLRNLDHSSKEASRSRVFNGFNEGDDQAHLERIHEALANSDALVLGNGRLFVDIALGFYSGPLPYFALLVSLARFMNKPIIIYSMSLVEPVTDAGKEHLRFLLANADLVVVREASSWQVARKHLSDMEKVKVLPDVAFALDAGDAGNDDLLPSVWRGQTIRPVAINFRTVNFDKLASEKDYLHLAGNITEWLQRYPERQLVMVPQATYNVDTPDTDDRVANQRVFASLPPYMQQRVHVVTEKPTLSQMLRLYQCVDGLFSARRHGFIMALTQGTPAGLFCHEKNTDYLRESLAFDALYLDGDELPAPDLGGVPQTVWQQVEQARQQTHAYASMFTDVLCGSKRSK